MSSSSRESTVDSRLCTGTGLPERGGTEEAKEVTGVSFEVEIDTFDFEIEDPSVLILELLSDFSSCLELYLLPSPPALLENGSNFYKAVLSRFKGGFTKWDIDSRNADLISDFLH